MKPLPQSNSSNWFPFLIGICHLQKKNKKGRLWAFGNHLQEKSTQHRRLLSGGSPVKQWSESLFNEDINTASLSLEQAHVPLLRWTSATLVIQGMKVPQHRQQLDVCCLRNHTEFQEVGDELAQHARHQLALIVRIISQVDQVTSKGCLLGRSRTGTLLSDATVIIHKNGPLHILGPAATWCLARPKQMSADGCEVGSMPFLLGQ